MSQRYPFPFISNIGSTTRPVRAGLVVQSFQALDSWVQSSSLATSSEEGVGSPTTSLAISEEDVDSPTTMLLGRRGTTPDSLSLTFSGLERMCTEMSIFYACLHTYLHTCPDATVHYSLPRRPARPPARPPARTHAHTNARTHERTHALLS